MRRIWPVFGFDCKCFRTGLWQDRRTETYTVQSLASVPRKWNKFYVKRKKSHSYIFLKHKHKIVKYKARASCDSTYVKRTLMKSEGEEAEEMSLERTHSRRSSGSASKRSGFSTSLRHVRSFFLWTIWPSWFCDKKRRNCCAIAFLLLFYQLLQILSTREETHGTVSVFCVVFCTCFVCSHLVRRCVVAVLCCVSQ